MVDVEFSPRLFGGAALIFQSFRGQLLVVRQPDHGVQTGLFDSRWGNESTPPFDPREAVIEAGTGHDNGWAAWEESPTLDPETGQPWQLFKLTPRQLSHFERPLVGEFLAEQALFQQSLAERLAGRALQTHATTDPKVWYTYLLLQVWDRLQLQFAWRLAADGEIGPLPYPDGSSGV